MTKKKEALYKDLLKKVSKMRLRQQCPAAYGLDAEKLCAYEEAVDEAVRKLEVLEHGYTVL